MYSLRPYQQQLIDEARTAFRQGSKEIILMSPTGSGKSVVIRSIIEQAKGSVLFVVHRKILLSQMQETLKGLNVDIFTLQKIAKTKTKRYNLIVHDECHYSWGSKLRNNLNSDFYLGLSATPLTADGYPLKCDKIISFMQMPQLIEQGYAVPFKVLSISTVDTKGLKKSGADYNNKEAYKLMSKSQIKKDILNVFNKYCRPENLKTVVYAVNIEHAIELHEKFTEDGIDCRVVHSKMKAMETIQDFKDNKFRVLINVQILTIGFDDGDIEALLLCAPTKSVILSQQVYGRVSRLPIKSKKTYGLILDCANVVSDSIHPMATIDMSRTKEEVKKPKCKLCQGDLEVIEKKITEKTALSFKLTTYKRCKTCKEVTIQEEIKVVELIQCDNCLKAIDKNIEMSMKDKKLEFVYKCDCGFEKVQREIVLTDQELKEIEYNEIMQTETWERVKKMLLVSCKRCGYNHRYSVRLIKYMQDRGISVKDAISAIEDLDSKGHKISKLMYGYFQ